MNGRASGGWSILHVGAYLNRPEYIELLVASGRLETHLLFISDDEGVESESTAAINVTCVPQSSASTVPSHVTPKYYGSALHVACSRGHAAVVRELQPFLSSFPFSSSFSL